MSGGGNIALMGHNDVYGCATDFEVIDHGPTIPGTFERTPIVE